MVTYKLGVTFVLPGQETPKWRTLLAEAAVASVVALLVAAVHLRLWRARWSEPFAGGGDASFYLMEVRSLGKFGTYLSSPNLGWPFGQSVHDLPQGVDNVHWLLLKLLYTLTGSVGGAVNVFYVLSFGTCAAAAMAVLRLFGLRRWLSLVLAVLYAFLPYHFARGEGHLLLSGYFMVPVGVLLAMSMFGDRLPFIRRTANGRLGLALKERRTWLLVAVCAVLASSGAYYMMFSLGLVVIAAVLAAVAARPGGRLAPMMAAGVIVVVTGFVFALNVSPTLLYTARNGANPGVAQRSPIETELYGLRVSQLVLPREQHRIAPLATIATRSQGKVVPSEGGQQLGAVGAAGFLLLLGSVAYAAIARRRDDLTAQAVIRLGLLNLACVLAGTVSGFSVLISAAGMSYIRAWNRISVVIGFLALLALGLVIERLLKSRKPGSLRWLPAVLGVGMLVGGIFDQTSQFDVPRYVAIHADATMSGEFFQAVADTVGTGGAVFSWPYVGFPETPDRGGTGAYDQAMGYVYQPDIRWSYGFARGRHPDYPDEFEKQPASQWLVSVVAIGFRSLVIDRSSTRGTNPAPDVEPDVISVLGAATKVSADGRYALYDLRAFAGKAVAAQGQPALDALAKRVLARG